ncbi:hypothetical protein SprV_0502005000 [Sparganum proliferum]
MAKNLDHLPYETRLAELSLLPLNYRQLRGDLIQTYQIVRGRECTLDFDESFELAEADRLRGHPFKLQGKLAHTDLRRIVFSRGATTIFAADMDIQEGQLVVFLLLHRKLNVREDGVEIFFECQHLIPFDDDEGIIHIPSPEFRWALLSGHTPGNRLDRRAKPGEGGNPLCALCRVHRVLRTPRTVGRMEHRVGAVVKWLRPRRWSAGWWNVASASSRRGSAWYAVGLPAGWIFDSASLTRAHLMHRRRPPAYGNVTGRVSSLTLAAWNVRSLLDNPRSNRPERRTALVARELARYKVDIAAPSETRFSEQGQLEEVGAGYTFF